jgi:hypothetical protein
VIAGYIRQHRAPVVRPVHKQSQRIEWTIRPAAGARSPGLPGGKDA